MTPSIIASIVALTNQHLPKRNQLTFVEITDGGRLLCKDRLDRRNVIVVGSYFSYSCFIRSVVREKVRGKSFNWLCNGQANKNAVQVGYWGGKPDLYTYV